MNETSVWVIFIAAIFTNNILLTNFLGMCSFIACSGQIKTSLGLGTAVIFVMVLTTMINYAVYYGVLLPFGLGHLQFIVFIAVIAAFVQLVEMFVERFSPKLYFALGIFLPLITVNCAILGGCLFMSIRKYNLAQSAGYGAGAGLGWWLAIIAMAGIRQRLQAARLPKGLDGPGITLLIAGIMALAFTGLAGMLNIR